MFCSRSLPETISGTLLPQKKVISFFTFISKRFHFKKNLSPSSCRKGDFIILKFSTKASDVSCQNAVEVNIPQMPFIILTFVLIRFRFKYHQFSFAEMKWYFMIFQFFVPVDEAYAIEKKLLLKLTPNFVALKKVLQN